MKANSNYMRAKILRTVERVPGAVSDDKLLIAQIWQSEGWDYMDSIYSNLRRVSSPETIRRTRQKLVEEGILKPSDKATESRYKEYEKARNTL